ncbi:hypothetical protein ACK30K_10770 [Aeromonas caviae]|uniref:hypothetical protein n=1 Tax=Aeromonas TaxID=642 RepID=UPI001F3DE936|nr:hypothetical protein [Aeromonas caviae]
MERNTSGTGEGIRVALALLLACALLMLPLWWQGGSQGHDLFHHLLSGHYFARQLWQGELYPRWLMAMNGGFGSPTFFFYPPLPYYVSALFAGPGAHSQQAIYPLLGSATLALLLSGVFAYLWLRATTPPGRALAGPWPPACSIWRCPIMSPWISMPASPWRSSGPSPGLPLSCWGRISPTADDLRGCPC